MNEEQIAKVPTSEERAENHKAISKMHRGNRFRLMFGLPLLSETKPNNKMINREIVAEAMYEAYCKAVGGIAFNGDPLPKWEEFAADPNKKKQSDAWLIAADRAIELLCN